MRLTNTQFELMVVERLDEIMRRLSLLSQAIARDNNEERKIMAVTQADIDALTQRVAANDAVEDAALDEIKADFAAFQTNNPGLDLSALQDQVTQAEQRAAQEQQVGTDNQPPQPSDGGTPAS